MKSSGVRYACFAVASCLLAACVSCNHSSSGSPSATSHQRAKPGPKESFDTIMETFKRRMEDTPVGFVVNNSNGRSSLTGQNKVDYELIEPKTESDPFKAVVKVTSRSRYSMKVQSEVPDESAREKNAKKTEHMLPEKTTKGQEQPFDPSAAKPSPDDSKSAATPTRTSEQVIPHEDNEVRKYDLLYQDGRWILVTELNKETEQAVQNAFKTALDTQI
jgi:hypothetical protein